MRTCFSLTEQQLDRIDGLTGPNRGFEIRLDTFTAPPNFPTLRATTSAPLLATWRTEPHLGKASTASRETDGWSQRKASLEAGFEYIDVELDEADLDQKIAHIQGNGGKVVLSHHELGDNAGIETALEKALATKADIIKIIGSGCEPADMARQRNFYRRADGRALVHFYMGAEFAATRVLCLVYGGAFTFLTPDAGQAVAPGQLTLEQVETIYKPLDICLDNLKLFAVIGAPIGHSKSPAFHNGPLKEIDPNALFLAVPANTGADLAMLRETFPEWVGMAVTKPMKEPAFEAAEGFADPHSQNLGAVNTLLFRKRGLHAANTDLLATIELLKAEGPNITVRVLGFGGLGKAVVRACLALNLPCEICNRTPGKVPENLGPGISERPWTERHNGGADVIVQATSAGMAPHIDTSPLDQIPEGAKVLIETIYNPLETKLMTMAKQAGLKVHDGLALFNGQAEIQNAFFKETLSMI